MRDIVSKHGTIRLGLSAPAAYTTGTTLGTAYDVSAYNGVMAYILAGTYTDGTHTVTFQSNPSTSNTAPSSGDSGWADESTSNLVLWIATSSTDFTPINKGNSQFQVMNSATTAVNQRIGYLGTNRWVRLKTVVSGTTTGAVYDAVIELGEPRLMPAVV